MNDFIKRTIIKSAWIGYNIPELALEFCCHKDKITHEEYLAFCNWAKKNENFYYWLKKRLHSNRG